MIEKFDILIEIADNQPVSYLSELALFALKCL